MMSLAFEAGLDQAAQLLERTAQDYDEMALQEMGVYNRLRGSGQVLRTHAHKQHSEELSRAAQLLRGQAKLIRQIET